MTSETVELGTASWYLRQLGAILRAVRKDRVPIVTVAIIVALAGAIAGKLTNSTTSTADLVLTPVPLRDATTEDDLSRMIAAPMDLKTASLLCMSDQTISRTRDMLEERQLLKAPIKSLHALKNALRFEITVAKDTPYETTYSPILRLTAWGGSSAEAKALVNTWAQACVESATEYLERKQAPLEEGFKERTDQVRTSLEQADDRLEAFRRENSLEYCRERVTALTVLINETLALRAASVQNMEKERAKRAALVSELASEEAKLKLNWTPSGRLTALLGEGLGLSDESGAEVPGMLEVEQGNPVYEVVRQQSATAQASASGYEAELKRIDEQLAAFDEELKTLQAESARVERMDRELLREVEVLETVYASASSKYEYAQMAAGLRTSEIHLLSEGAEWRMPRFRRAIMFGVAGGIWGFLLAALASVVLRQVVRPALEQAP